PHKQILEKSNPNLIFRSFEGAIPTVVLARKGGIDASKPPIRTRMGENLCGLSTNPSDCFAPLFQKREPKQLERFIISLTFHTKTI
ncbi:MAG: hypothetical protein IKJ04_00650, partial [Clostridia bacterium]|nr:hypothetical protein [Clostridia bacterium]